MQNQLSTGEIFFGRYKINEFVAKGGYGAIYKADDLHFGRQVAIKILRQRSNTSPYSTPQNQTHDYDQNLTRFEQEARICALFHNPHIITVYERNPPQAAECFLVMPYLPGSLYQQLQKSTPKVKWARQIAQDICEALILIHQKDVVHCDLKPKNILLDENDSAVVADFGSAQLRGSPATGISERGFQGSRNYMSPEQHKGQTILTAASDLYNLGLIMYEMVTGYPFAAHKGFPPSQLNKQVPGWYDRIVHELLQEELRPSYRSAREVLVALRAGDTQTNPTLLAATADSDEFEDTADLLDLEAAPPVTVGLLDLPAEVKLTSDPQPTLKLDRQATSTELEPTVRLNSSPSQSVMSSSVPTTFPASSVQSQTLPTIPASSFLPNAPTGFGSGGRPSRPLVASSSPSYSSRRRAGLFLLVGLVGLVVVLLGLLLLVLFGRSSSGFVVGLGTPTAAIPTSSVFVVSSTSSPFAATLSPTLAPAFTPTTGFNPSFEMSPTSSPAPSPTPSPSATPTVAPSPTPNPDEQNLALGKTEYDNKHWAEAAALFEKLTPVSLQAKEAHLLLLTCYTEQGRAAFVLDNELKSAEVARDFYEKASKLEPGDAELEAMWQKLILYSRGRAQYENKQWNIAVIPLRTLYYGLKGPERFRDTTEIYYNCWVLLGQDAFGSGQWLEAKSRYEEALKVNVSDKGLAQNGLKETNEKLNPVTPTPTPIRPTPTLVPPPPPPPPAAPCSRGGSGSNFYAYESGGTGLGDAPDQGLSNITGTVVDRNNNRLVGAVVVASSGGYNYTTTTNGNGSYQFGANLGKGYWAVRVVGAPGRTLCDSRSSVVGMNGHAGAIGTVSFTESVP